MSGNRRSNRLSSSSSASTSVVPIARGRGGNRRRTNTNSSGSAQGGSSSVVSASNSSGGNNSASAVRGSAISQSTRARVSATSRSTHALRQTSSRRSRIAAERIGSGNSSATSSAVTSRDSSIDRSDVSMASSETEEPEVETELDEEIKPMDKEAIRRLGVSDNEILDDVVVRDIIMESSSEKVSDVDTNKESNISDVRENTNRISKPSNSSERNNSGTINSNKSSQPTGSALPSTNSATSQNQSSFSISNSILGEENNSEGDGSLQEAENRRRKSNPLHSSSSHQSHSSSPHAHSHSQSLSNQINSSSQNNNNNRSSTTNNTDQYYNGSNGDSTENNNNSRSSNKINGEEDESGSAIEEENDNDEDGPSEENSSSDQSDNDNPCVCNDKCASGICPCRQRGIACSMGCKCYIYECKRNPRLGQERTIFIKERLLPSNPGSFDEGDRRLLSEEVGQMLIRQLQPVITDDEKNLGDLAVVFQNWCNGNVLLRYIRRTRPQDPSIIYEIAAHITAYQRNIIHYFEPHDYEGLIYEIRKKYCAVDEDVLGGIIKIYADIIKWWNVTARYLLGASFKCKRMWHQLKVKDTKIMHLTNIMLKLMTDDYANDIDVLGSDESFLNTISEAINKMESNGILRVMYQYWDALHTGPAFAVRSQVGDNRLIKRIVTIINEPDHKACADWMLTLAIYIHEEIPLIHQLEIANLTASLVRLWIAVQDYIRYLKNKHQKSSEISVREYYKILRKFSVKHTAPSFYPTSNPNPPSIAAISSASTSSSSSSTPSSSSSFHHRPHTAYSDDPDHTGSDGTDSQASDGDGDGGEGNDGSGDGDSRYVDEYCTCKGLCGQHCPCELAHRDCTVGCKCTALCIKRKRNPRMMVKIDPHPIISKSASFWENYNLNDGKGVIGFGQPVGGYANRLRVVTATIDNSTETNDIDDLIIIGAHPIINTDIPVITNVNQKWQIISHIIEHNLHIRKRKLAGSDYNMIEAWFQVMTKYHQNSAAPQKQVIRYIVDNINPIYIRQFIRFYNCFLRILHTVTRKAIGTYGSSVNTNTITPSNLIVSNINTAPTANTVATNLTTPAHGANIALPGKITLAIDGDQNIAMFIKNGCTITVSKESLKERGYDVKQRQAIYVFGNVFNSWPPSIVSRDQKAFEDYNTILGPITTNGVTRLSRKALKQLFEYPDAKLVLQAIQLLTVHEQRKIESTYRKSRRLILEPLMRKSKRKAKLNNGSPQEVFKRYLNTKHYNPEALTNFLKHHYPNQQPINPHFGKGRGSKQDEENDSPINTSDEEEQNMNRYELQDGINQTTGTTMLHPALSLLPLRNNKNSNRQKISLAANFDRPTGIVVPPKEITALQAIDVSNVPAAEKGNQYTQSSIAKLSQTIEKHDPLTSDVYATLKWLKRLINIVETCTTTADPKNKYGRVMWNTVKGFLLINHLGYLIAAMQQGDGTRRSQKYEIPAPHPVEGDNACISNDYPGWRDSSEVDSGWNDVLPGISIQVLGRNYTIYKTALKELPLAPNEDISLFNRTFLDRYLTLNQVASDFIEEETAKEDYRATILKAFPTYSQNFTDTRRTLREMMGDIENIDSIERRYINGTVPATIKDRSNEGEAPNKRYKMNTGIMKCFNCNRMGHLARNCRDSPAKAIESGERGNSNNNNNNNNNSTAKKFNRRNDSAADKVKTSASSYSYKAIGQEDRKEGQPVKTENDTTNNNGARVCTHCNKTSHMEPNCWKKYPEKAPRNDYSNGNGGSREQSKLWCATCRTNSHNTGDCRSKRKHQYRMISILASTSSESTPMPSNSNSTSSSSSSSSSTDKSVEHVEKYSLVSDVEYLVPSVFGRVNGKVQEKIYLDTAATLSIACLRYLIANNLTHLINKANTVKLLLASNEDSIETLGTFEATVSLGEIFIGKVVFHVIKDNNQRFTIGIPTIVEKRMVMDFSSVMPRLHIGENSTPLLNKIPKRKQIHTNEQLNQLNVLGGVPLANSLNTDYNKLADLGRMSRERANKLIELQQSYINLQENIAVQQLMDVITKLINPNYVQPTGVSPYIMWQHHCNKVDGTIMRSSLSECQFGCGQQHPDCWKHSCYNGQTTSTMDLICKECDQANPKVPGKVPGTTWSHQCTLTSISCMIAPDRRRCATCHSFNPNYQNPSSHSTSNLTSSSSPSLE